MEGKVMANCKFLQPWQTKAIPAIIMYPNGTGDM